MHIRRLCRDDQQDMNHLFKLPPVIFLFLPLYLGHHKRDDCTCQTSNGDQIADETDIGGAIPPRGCHVSRNNNQVGGTRVTEPETFAPFSANAARLREPHGLSHKAFERRRAEQKGAIDQNKAAVRI